MLHTPPLRALHHSATRRKRGNAANLVRPISLPSLSFKSAAAWRHSMAGAGRAEASLHVSETREAAGHSKWQRPDSVKVTAEIKRSLGDQSPEEIRLQQL